MPDALQLALIRALEAPRAMALKAPRFTTPKARPVIMLGAPRVTMRSAPLVIVLEAARIVGLNGSPVIVLNVAARRAACVIGLTALAAAALAVAAVAQNEKSPPPTTAVGRMGEVMSAWSARRGIGFVPFAPPRTITQAALLPPFRGADTRANRGIGFEYVDSAGRRYALAQWPRNGGSIDRFPALWFRQASCPDARTIPRGTSPNGIVWTTSRGLVLTLVADGPNDARTLEREWSKLIRRGACR